MNILQIETINSCNARCKFCSYPLQKEKRKPMTMELYKKIIDSAADYVSSGGVITQVMPFLNGEPWLDPTLVEKCLYVNEKLPSSGVVFYSNGNLMTPDKVEKIKAVKNLGMNFSINHINEQGREFVMGLPLKPAVDNIVHAHKVLDGVNFSVSAVLSTRYMTAFQIHEFRELWARQHQIRPNLFHEGNWAGKTYQTCNTTGTCGRPDTVMTVLSDGRVVLCCYDIDGEVVFGDLNTQSVKEVWESDAYEEYRFKDDAGRRRELKLCSQCTTG